MSDLKPSSGSGGTSDKALRAKGPKRTPEVTKEERVSCQAHSSGCVVMFLFFLADSWHVLVIFGTHRQWLVTSAVSGHRAVHESRPRGAKWIFLWRCVCWIYYHQFEKKNSWNYHSRNFALFLKSNFSCFCMKFFHLAKCHHSHACLYCVAQIISHICMRRKKKYGSLHCSVLHPQFNT